ncbi:GlxA family transcriptional regulator [Pseudoduganella aquatica]|uniref:Helix-turn-helix domain-containing protein n=1 Tax=Pseudoduganella aquatica TaxID=2660641 RepID=A0A7X4KND5_9BURK|nr:GlxA family transcriptional regulator [Pseudoduganella aquatica]MYN08066.1 helix-turn-helix domain-containing protein [Pseudoduganella aquatica]
MRIALLIFPGVQMLDAVGPLEVFSEAARQAGKPDAYQLELVAPQAGPVQASNGMALIASAAMDAVDGGIDTLLVAGSPHIDALDDQAALLEWLRTQAGQVRRLGSVCSGAFLLARAGLLDGKHVTTHWNSSAKLARKHPKVHVEADQIYVRDGTLYTSAGVSAGMDLALALVEEDLGRETALNTARELVMFLKRPGGQSQFSAHLAAQSSERSAIREVQEWVLASLAEPMSVDDMAARAGMSTRNFSRLFKQDTGMTPADFVEGARIDAARRLLEDTANPLKRVAAWSGFGNPNGLRRAFQRRLGVTPGDYRMRFQKTVN